MVCAISFPLGKAKGQEFLPRLFGRLFQEELTIFGEGTDLLAINFQIGGFDGYFSKLFLITWQWGHHRRSGGIVRLKTLLAAGIGLLALSNGAYAGDQVLIAPPPEWVVASSIKQAAPSPGIPATQGEQDLPVRVVNVDYQIRLEPDRQSIYTAMAIKFLTPQGLSGGNLSLPWQPDTGTMTIHSVRIRRGDEIIDVLEEGQTFSVLRREQSLEIATLDGVLTANMFPAGLEVGDVLELAYTVTTSHPVLKGHAEVLVPGLNMPKDRVHVLIEWPEKHPVRLSQTYGLPEWKRSRRSGFEVAEMTLENVEPILPPRMAPSRYGIFRLIEASDFSSWSQVGQLFRPLYDEASQIPPDGRLRQEVEQIRAASEDPLKRAELALDLVQDKVRYVALAMGAGGLKPAMASETWSRRFGDCKGKTALLLGLLRELGIEAEAVLVSSSGGDSIPERLPMAGVFDHVLVRTVIDGREYWLDGTRSGDGALADLIVPPFEWGLPVRASGAELVRMMPGPLEKPEEDLAIRIDASAGLRLPAPTEIRLVTRGDTAQSFNAALSSMTGNVRKEALEAYWRGRFDFVKPDKVDTQFDQATGELVLTLTGKAEMDWDRSRYQADGMWVGYSADFSRSDGPNKDAPFAAAHPFFNRTVETIILPPGFTGDQIDGKTINETVAGVEYHREASLADSVFTATVTRRSLASEFPASEAEAAAKRLKALADEAVYIRIPFNYQRDSAEREHILTQYEEDANGRIGRGLDLMGLGRYQEALADFDKAGSLDPENVWAWANKAIAQVWLKDMAGAREAVERAAKIDPDNPVVLRGQGMIAQQEKDFPKAITAFRRSIERDNSGYAHYSLAHILFAGGEVEEALVEVDRAIKLTPGFVTQYPLRVDVLMALKRKEDAIQATDEMLGIFPRDPSIVTYASSFYENVGEYEKAEQARKLALNVPPTPGLLVERANRRPVSETDKKIAELDEALRLDPNFVPALISRGNALWMEYDYKRALADVNKAIEIAPDAWLAYDVKAKVLADTNRRKEAAATAEQAITANPKNPYVYMMVANIYQRLGMAAQAQSVRDRQQKLEPESASDYLNRANARAKEDVVGQKQDIEAALRMEPDLLPALIMKSSLQGVEQDWVGAAETLTRARKIAPTDPQPANLQGVAWAKAGREAEAEEAFAVARELAVDAQMLNNICFEKAMRGVALERALEECSASLALYPDVGYTLDSRGLVYLRLGRLQEAEADFDLAIEKLPGVPNSLFGRAVARALSGNLSGARADAAAALRLSPAIQADFKHWEIPIPPEILPR